MFRKRSGVSITAKMPVVDRALHPLSRREMLKASVGAGAWVIVGGCAPRERVPELATKLIPATGEPLPVIGIGTALDHYSLELPPEEVEVRRQVFQEFTNMGGRVLDLFAFRTAEEFCGNLVRELGIRDQFFIASKVGLPPGSTGEGDLVEVVTAQMSESLSHFGTEVIDLMQIVNLQNWESWLPVLREWKQEGRLRYVGVTVFLPEQHEALEVVMRREELDFVQLNYSIGGREAEDVLLPLAADRGMAVIANVPFGRGDVFRRLGDRPLPGWAAELGCESMAQVALKFIVSHPSVTCAIPGTYKLEYLLDNMGAAAGPMPDAPMRRTMAGWFDGLPQSG